MNLFFKDGKRLSFVDFSQEEITTLTELVNNCYSGFLEGSGINRNLSFETLTALRSRIYIAHEATKKILETPFPRLGELNVLLSSFPTAWYEKGVSRDVDNMNITDLDNFRIPNGKASHISQLLTQKLGSNLDFVEAKKQCDIKGNLDFYAAWLKDRTGDLDFFLKRKQSEGTYINASAKDTISDILNGMMTLAPASTPYVIVAKGLFAALNDFFNPTASDLLNEDLTYFTWLTNDIKERTTQIKNYLDLIHSEGYDYDFAKCQIIPFVKAPLIDPTPTPNPHTNVKPFSAPKSNAPYAIVLVIIFLLFLITRNKHG